MTYAKFGCSWTSVKQLLRFLFAIVNVVKVPTNRIWGIFREKQKFISFRTPNGTYLSDKRRILTYHKPTLVNNCNQWNVSRNIKKTQPANVRHTVELAKELIPIKFCGLIAAPDPMKCAKNFIGLSCFVSEISLLKINNFRPFRTRLLQHCAFRGDCDFNVSNLHV